MVKKLILTLLILTILTSTAYAGWRFNPYTRKLDYHIGNDPNFTGDITTTGTISANHNFTGKIWKKYSQNPLMKTACLFRSIVRVSSDDWYEYEEYHNGSIWELYYRTSSNGLDWSSPRIGPLLEEGGVGSDDEWGQADPTVIYNGPGDWEMFYDVYQKEGGWPGIGRATSSDGMSWSKDAVNNLVMELGAGGTWDDIFIHHPCVIIVDSIYYLYYAGHNGDGIWHLGLATSSDGINWTKEPTNPVLSTGAGGEWDDEHLRPGHPFIINDTWYMLYWGFDGSNSRLGLATSPDGIVWTKQGIVFDLGDAGELDSDSVMVSQVLKIDNVYKLWYISKGDPGPSYRLTHAVLTEMGKVVLEGIGIGALVFGGANEELEQSPLELTWDNANSRLGISSPVPVETLDVHGTFATTGSITVGGITTTGTIRSATTLYLQPDATAHINCFGQTEVGNDIPGKSLYVYRRADEYDGQLRLFIDQWGEGYLTFTSDHVTDAFRIFNSSGGDIEFRGDKFIQFDGEFNFDDDNLTTTGTAAFKNLYIVEDDAITDNQINVADFKHTSSGTPTDGFGVGISLSGEHGDGSDYSLTSLNSYWSDEDNYKSGVYFTVRTADNAELVLLLLEEDAVWVGGDTTKLKFGDSKDVEMYYDNSKFIIDDTTTQKIDFADNDLTTTGTGTDSQHIITKSADGADVNLTIINTAAIGSSDETVSIIAQTGSNDPMGKIVFGRAADYEVGSKDSFMDFYTTINETDTLALTIDEGDFDFQAGDLTTTGTAATGALTVTGGVIADRFTLGNDEYSDFGSYALMYWETTGNDNLQLGLNVNNASYSGYFSLINKSDVNNANRSPLTTTADPTLRIYSSDAGQPNDYIETYYSTALDAGVIALGQGTLRLYPGGAATDPLIFFAVGNERGFNICENIILISDPDTDEFKVGVDDKIGNQFVLVNYDNFSKDHDHVLQANPTLYVHSNTDPDDNNTEWGSLAHTGTGTGDGMFTILSGTGEISFDDDNLTTTGTITTSSFTTTGTIYTDFIESNATTGINFDDTNLTTTGSIKINADNTKLTIGKDADIEWYHNGTNAIYNNADGATIFTSAGNNQFKTAGRDWFMDFFAAGSFGGFAIHPFWQFRHNESYDQVLMAVADDMGRQFVICDYDTSRSRDADHSPQSNPTLFIHSVTDLNTANDEWISFTHDVTDAIIDWGSGDLKLTGGNLDLGSGNFTTTGTIFFNDTNTGIYEGASSNLTFLDAVTGSRTLAQLVAGGGGVAGSDTQIQFNDGGSFAGDAGFVYDKGLDALTTTGTGSFGTLILGSGSITDTSNAISFGNEELTTTGKGIFGELQVDTINLDANTITTTSGNLTIESSDGNVIFTGSDIFMTYATIDLGNNTITDETMVGDWDFSLGNLTTAGDITTTSSGTINIATLDTSITFGPNGETDSFINYDGTYLHHFSTERLLFEADKVIKFDAGWWFELDSNEDFSFKDTGTQMFGLHLDKNIDQNMMSFNDEGGNHLVISTYDNRNDDFDHGVQANPTMFFHSDTTDGVAMDEWGSITHDTTDFLFDAGKGKANFSDLELTTTGTITTGTFFRANATRYRRYYHLPMSSFAPGASGATWTPASVNNLCGWNLDVNTEVLETNVDIHSDWDEASDMTVEVFFTIENDPDNGHTADLQLIAYYAALGDTATKSQTPAEVEVISNGTQWEIFKATFIIDWDDSGNVVEIGDQMCFVLNFQTGTSEVTDIIINSATFYYNTTHIGIEETDT